MQRKSLSITCDTCGYDDEEPLYGGHDVAFMRLRERGWQIDTAHDYCRLCVGLTRG